EKLFFLIPYPFVFMKTIELEEGWNFMQKGITKLKKILEGHPYSFSSEEYMMLYETIYNMCKQKPPHDYSQQLYEKYKETFEEYINSTVLSSLREKHNEFMLRELVKRWENHKVMVRWLSRFFHYLDRYFIARRSLPALNEVGLTCFRDLVYQELKSKARDAVIALIDQEREGEQIDRALLKNVLGIFVEIGMGEMEFYENDFEDAMLKDTAAYYSRKASNWIVEDSCPDYMLKAEECLKKEKDRVSHYLHSSSETKLLEKVQNELLVVYTNQLLEKEHSGCRALLRDDKVEDLSRMYRLFHRIPKGLEQVANVFKQAESSSGSQEQVFVRKVIELLDKYMAYVTDSFANNSLFHKVLKEAFEVFCNKFFAGCSSAELLVSYCDNILKKGGSEKLSDDAIEETLDKVVKCLAFISDTTLVLQKVQNELLVVYTNQLLEKEHSGCRALLRDDKVEDLSRMYRLFHRIPKGLEPVANMFKQHVTEGMVLVQQAEDSESNKAESSSGSQEQVFVRKVIELLDKYMAYVTDSFANNSLFHKVLKEAFEVFCNNFFAGCSSAELLASYCDNILKKGGSEKLSDDAIEETLDKVVKCLAFISDKDLFAAFYRKKLSRRLLFDKSANDDHERLILTKLKQQYGGQFTSKMEGMVTDLTLAKENQSHFQEYLSNNSAANPGIDLTVRVLTTGFWPSYKSSDLSLPVEMVKCVEVFKEFYQTKTKHRKLTWIYSLDTCNINGKFESKTIELIVGTYQAAALLLFNASDRLSYSDIKSQLNLADDDLIRLLQSLSCAKYKILTKEPSNRTVSSTDHFEFNSKFTDRMRRIRIPLPFVDERKKVVEDVDKDRRYAIDACIVRIMKSRKVLPHQQLVLECVEQLSRMFKPDFKAIKKRIEDLITRDYLERDKENPNLFKYLA
ncbi:hypothetical protein AABB24_019887, partial [Solanum stoloniferum]